MDNAKPVKLGKFRGINNRLPAERLRPLGDRNEGAFVHDAKNVDLTDAGSFQRRPGFARHGIDVGCRGLISAGDHAYYVSEADIKRLELDGSASVIGTVTSPFAPISCVETPRGVVLSDTFRLQLLNGSAATPLAPQPPALHPMVSAIAGTLSAGAYSLFFVAQDADGVRSAPTLPLDITLPADSGLQIAAPVRACDLLLFLTTPDGEAFYHVTTLGAAQASTVVTSALFDGESMAYEPQALMPPGNVMGYHKGRLYSGVGSVVFYSLPYQYGLYRPAIDFIPMPAPIALFASVDEGLFIATTQMTYFLPGGDPTKEKLQQVLPFGAVPHSLTVIPDSNDLVWFSERGPVRTKGGSVELLQNENIAFQAAARGASVVREQNGLRSLIASLAGTMPSGGAVVGSYMDAEVIKGA